MHDALGGLRQPWQCRRGFEHALGQRCDRVEVPVRAVLDQGLAQRAQMARRVVNTGATVQKRVIQVADGTMKRCDDASGRARLRR